MHVILITSNTCIRDWPVMLVGDDTIATAILGRVLHASHLLNIDGCSYRLRDLGDHMSGPNQPLHYGAYSINA